MLVGIVKPVHFSEIESDLLYYSPEVYVWKTR